MQEYLKKKLKLIILKHVGGGAYLENVKNPAFDSKTIPGVI